MPLIKMYTVKARLFHNSSGGWKVSSFIIGVVFCQALAKFAITGMLSDYLSDVLDLPNAQASVQIMLMEGSTAFLTVAFFFLADEHLGLYYVLLASIASYFCGLLLFTLSIPNNRFYFYLALLLLAVGVGGHECSLKKFCGDQFAAQMVDDEDKKEKVQFHSKIWWCMGSFMGGIAGIIIAISSSFRNNDDNLQMWIVGGVLSTMCMGIAFYVFVAGTYCYDVRVVPHNTAFVVMVRVLMAAILHNRHLDYYSAVEEDRINGGRRPQDSNGRHVERGCGREGLDTVPTSGYRIQTTSSKNDALWLPHTDGLSWLDKAAIIEKASENATSSDGESKWRLCTQTEVEGTKILLRLFYTWSTLLIFGVFESMISSFFVQQANDMDILYEYQDIFALPATIFFAITSLPATVGSTVSNALFTWVLKRKYRMTLGAGLIMGLISCFTASSVEARRLKKVNSPAAYHSAAQYWGFLFWLVPQFFLTGTMKGFFSHGISELFCDEVPHQFRDFKRVFLQSIFAMGSLLSALLVVVLDKVTIWFGQEINTSRLDLYYRTIGILGLLNLCFYAGIVMRATGNEREEEPEIDIELAVPIE